VTPLHFEELYQAEWQELEGLLGRMLGRGREAGAAQPVSGERVAALYRRACEHLAIARARSYPAYLLARLERLTADAHRQIYRRRDFGVSNLKQLLLADFPRAVRAHARYVWTSAALLIVPMLAAGLLVYARPELILSVVSADTAASFERMYSPAAESIGHARTADTDWTMFGFYIRNNIGIAFQCFAGGVIAGLGTLFFILYNGAFIGAIAGYVTQRGFAAVFFPFVVTHSAFELTAIVLSGAAGLRLGAAVLAPGESTRVQALVGAARESVVIVYGVAALLLVAAAIEAFWSSARWLPPPVKFGVAAACWIAVLAYLTLQGRRAG